jgi:predicted CoA-binding protein
MRYGDDDTIKRLLTDTTTWAMVGLSDDPSRTSYRIAAYLRERGKRVVPVHPSAETVHGERGYASLRDIPFPIEVVDVFVRSEHAGEATDDAIAIGAGGVWMQLGIRDEAAAARAEKAGLAVVMDTCPHIEGPRLLGWPRKVPGEDR